MSDEDRAQALELLDWERNNRSRPQRLRYIPGDPGYGPGECAECGDDMPPERRAMGSHVCTGCKVRQEELQRRRAG